MTTSIEALTYISNARWNENADLDDICTMADRALASLEGDAVERVALRRTVLDILNSVAPAVENLACNQEQADADGCMVKVSRQAVDEVLAAVNEVAIQAATATGLVAGEAAIRGDWHTTGWDRARNSGRILLVWREFAGVREHVELGRYSDSKTAWVNTYGHPFHGEPDGWAPLLPFKNAEAIRADEREKCATYRNALLWAFDRLSVTGGMNANEQRRTMREIGNVLTGKASPAATYQPNDWDDSAAIRSGDVA